MTKYAIKVNRRYQKELKKIPLSIRKKIAVVVGKLEFDPRPDGYKKLKGKINPALYRIRCGDYRIIYTIEDDVLIIVIIEIGHRKQIYRIL